MGPARLVTPRHTCIVTDCSAVDRYKPRSRDKKNIILGSRDTTTAWSRDTERRGDKTRKGRLALKWGRSSLSLSLSLSLYLFVLQTHTITRGHCVRIWSRWFSPIRLEFPSGLACLGLPVLATIDPNPPNPYPLSRTTPRNAASCPHLRMRSRFRGCRPRRQRPLHRRGPEQGSVRGMARNQTSHVTV
jgi:hypothetical protein